MSSPFSPGTKILAGGALLLGLVLLVGFLLPGRWEATVEATVAAPPAQVMGLIDGPGGWRRWTAWPESEVAVEGPEHGAGARISWKDMDLGTGSFEIVGVEGDSLVRYTVSVEEGAMRTDGVMRLSALPSGATLVRWSEQGDFGWNPLMGYWALMMDGVQERQLQHGLMRLGEAVVSPTTPADAPRR